MTFNNKKISKIYIPISYGELIDKITILEIKKNYMRKDQLDNVNKELKLLEDILQEKELEVNTDLKNELRQINRSLWQIEDKIRIKERKQEFDEEFIKLARSVYKENDKRASIKKNINYTYNSEIFEEKYYQNY
ncbi:DUF6165 family protein [Prochlorococcus marinus]|uniref:DUF6165 family protein n=1 Tax=Prochlorococcus marinus TaxID=1219 RepID=UPI0022B45FAC|nr:DUF6165 family protein [Prochlorococcus marinus]